MTRFVRKILVNWSLKPCCQAVDIDRTMRARWWEAGIAIVGIVLSALYFVVGSPVMGAIFLAAAAAWLAYRVRVVRTSPNPGAFAYGRALEDTARALVTWLGLLLVSGLLFVDAAQHWLNDLRGQVATFSLAALAVLLAQECERQRDSAFARYDGALAEERVVETLAPLEALGWSFTNNFLLDDGDIDVIARAPSRRVYAIETKSNPSGLKGLGQAVGNAIRLRGRYPRVGFVNAVVCVPGNRPAKQYGSGWVVGLEKLVDWLRTDPGL